MLALLIALPVADAAAASCAGGPRGQLKRAPWVFVGTVIQQDISTARIDVEQVWRGPDLAPRVLVQTGQTQPPWPLSLFLASGSSGDATLEPGNTYVIALEDDQQRLRTNTCAVAEATKPLLARAPDDARDPVADGLSGIPSAPFNLALVAAGGALLVAMGIALLVIRRRRG